MMTVLVDTNVLIALVDRTDDLHTTASKDLSKLARAELRVTSAVFCESAFALARADQRGRLSLLIERLPISPAVAEDERQLRRDTFAWLARYADHAPDYADGELCVLAGQRKGLRIWTYDAEFRTVWRTQHGHRLSTVGK